MRHFTDGSTAGGLEQKGHFLPADLPNSDDSFVVVFPADNAELVCQGHNQAFACLAACRVYGELCMILLRCFCAAGEPEDQPVPG